MELWVVITVGAAFMQNLRSALQKYITAELSTAGAAYCRFLYAAPLAVVYVVVLGEGLGMAWLAPNARFALFAALGGIAQIAGTVALVALFSLRNFTVGTVYSKTETVQAAAFGLVVLGEPVSAPGAFAIGVSFVGLVLISTMPGRRVRHDRPWNVRAVLLGIASGALFGFSAVAYRGAALALGGDGFLMPAAITLAGVLVFQSAVMAAYLALREPGEVRRVLRQWRTGSLVGAAGMAGSAGWFTAMTLENAAYVRAVGQVELVFTFAASYFLFRERPSGQELIGALLIVAGIVILLLG